jgi:hypothetical protein
MRLRSAPAAHVRCRRPASCGSCAVPSCAVPTSCAHGARAAASPSSVLLGNAISWYCPQNP